MRTETKPGSRISLGSENKVVGYNVTYRYQGQEQTVRMRARTETASAGAIRAAFAIIRPLWPYPGYARPLQWPSFCPEQGL